MDKRRVQEELIDFYGSLPPSSRIIYHDLQEGKQRQQHADGGGGPDKSLNVKRNHMRDASGDKSSKRKIRSIDRSYKGRVSEGKAHMELNPVRDVESDKKDFYRYTISKRRLRKIWNWY
ncbi:hypothetical protein llap_9160 [Limosa lapponica baueri]|uniref:Uncharacterized protein n=1 Tax=Limosa lapponica baueri TaxID=1758121 RepID=A0A2I0U3A3_LIMLA|nr:hypothetical protein llap_9160 [Limosa lapponica baueri]